MKNTEQNYLANNKITLCGKVSTNPEFSHQLFEENFFEFFLEVSRLSENCDILPITISEKMVKEHNIKIGDVICLDGQFRSYNKIVDNKSKLMLTVFVRDILFDTNESINNIHLSGYICKAPIYRTTPFNREICDVLIAVNRAYNKSDYIPCIAWGKNARIVKDINIGQRLTVVGRIQSREYSKKLSDTEVETRVAYEVSVSRVELKDSNIIDFKNAMDIERVAQNK